MKIVIDVDELKMSREDIGDYVTFVGQQIKDGYHSGYTDPGTQWDTVPSGALSDYD